MRTIEAVTVFRYGGRQYESLEKVRGAWEDEVADFVRRICSSGRFGPKEQILVTEALLANREELIGLLDLRMSGGDE